MEIVVLDGGLVNRGDLGWEPIEALGHLTCYTETRPEEVADRLKNAEAVLLNRTILGEREITAAPRLRYIGLFATGYNGIDLAAASRRDITVANVPGYSTSAVAQHTMALLLYITNNIHAFDAGVKAGGWREAVFLPMTGLAGKTMGIVGFGEIGRAVGRIAAALGMEVLAAGSRPTEEGRLIGEYVPLEDLQRRADIISLHCPLVEATRGLVNAGFLAGCRRGTILLNTARGGLVDEAALAAALESGQVRAAGLDVTNPEPLAETSPLLKVPNCVITPHTAWAPPETRRALIESVAANLAAFQRGEPLNVVNN